MRRAWRAEAVADADNIANEYNKIQQFMTKSGRSKSNFVVLESEAFRLHKFDEL